ncbi:MAG: type 1 glutamine amidotransferase domain-containing protein [Solirubrobacterales bacterium]
MGDRLKDRTIAFLAADGVEQIELTEPWKAVEEAGGTPKLVSLESGEIQGMEGEITPKDTFEVDMTVDEASEDQFRGLVIPGGVGNPDNLRANDKAVAFVRSFFETGKPVSAICHAPWVLIEANAVEGRRLTSYPSIKTDLLNAGADWVDEEVVVDKGLTTSRSPDDLEAFCEKTVEEMCEGVHEEQATRTPGVESA